MKAFVFILTAMLTTSVMAQGMGKIESKQLSVKVLDFSSIIMMHTQQNNGTPEPFSMIEGRLQRLSDVIDRISSTPQLNDEEKKLAMSSVTSCVFISTGVFRSLYQVEGIEKISSQDGVSPIPMTVIRLSDESALACVRPSKEELTLADIRQAVGSILQVNYKNK